MNASDATAGSELHPHAYFVEALLVCDGEITGQEFVLFTSRARTHDDLEKSVERIRAWRDLPPGDRSDITQALYTTDYPKIQRDHTHSMAFHHCDLLVERAQGKIYVHGDKIDELRRRLEAHKGVSEIIDFWQSCFYPWGVAQSNRDTISNTPQVGAKLRTITLEEHFASPGFIAGPLVVPAARLAFRL